MDAYSDSERVLIRVQIRRVFMATSQRLVEGPVFPGWSFLRRNIDWSQHVWQLPLSYKALGALSLVTPLTEGA